MASMTTGQTPQAILAQPLTLPCGHTIPNRIIKAAMTEQMATAANAPTDALVRLYERWGRGGTGVLLTGNVMVDHRALEGPRNVAVEDERDLPMLRRWAEAAQANGSQLWMQISHPGRQTPMGVSSLVVAPSAIALKGTVGKMFSPPRALEHDEILEIIERFATTAAIAKEAGFSGVQIHSAHGYLNSQFLSPSSNRRTDAWGGPIENRMRMLLAIVRETRKRVGAAYPIALKLNSADFQTGGFTQDESLLVVQAVEREGVDLLEISGGNYENPMMMMTGEAMARLNDYDRRREAYFLDYAEKVRGVARLPLMLTGGLRTVAVMASLVEEGLVDVAGLARPLAIDPDFTRKALDGELDRAPPVRLYVGYKLVDGMIQSMWHQEQMKLMGAGLEPNLRISRFSALAKGVWNVFGPRRR